MSAGRDSDWAQKYRPRSFDDLLLPSCLAKPLSVFARQGGGMSMMFYGPPGTGKTSTACALNPQGTFYIDCSRERTVDGVRRLVGSCSTVPIFSDRRLVVLDEADSLTGEAQACLKGAVEHLSICNDFIAITNRREGLTAALRSRLHPVRFDHVRDLDFESRIVQRLKAIAEREEANIPMETILTVARDAFPDMRRMLKTLQFESAR